MIYDTPFYGKDQDIKLPKYEFAYDCNGGRDTLLFTDGEPMIINYEANSYGWGYIDDCKIDDYFMPCVKGIIVIAHASDSIYATCDTITLKTKYGKQKTITVTRGAAKPRISFGEQSEYSLPINGGTKNINLDTNIPFDKIDIDNSKAKWCKATLESYREYGYHYKRLVLTIESNETDEKRRGNITLKYKDGTQSATINVVQDAPYFECDYNTENYYSTSYGYGYRQIFYKSNIENLKAESNVDWINELGLDSYYDYSRLMFCCDSNYSDSSREGIITISDKSGKVIHSIKVVQARY